MGHTLHLVASVVLFSALSVACGSTAAPHSTPVAGAVEHPGSLALSLVPVTGVALDQLQYVVTQGSVAPIAEGEFPTTGTASTVSIALPLPPGDGYQLSLSGDSTQAGDHISCGGSFGPFGVHSGASTSLDVGVECHQTKDGPVDPSTQIVVDACPRLKVSGIVANPSTVEVGSASAISGSAYDLDGLPVTYTWTPTHPGLSFSSSTGERITATCLTKGLDQTVVLTVGNGECTKQLSTAISCNETSCGNGVIDPGETCDTALPAPCPADCTAVCGDGVAEAPVEDCDPPTPGVCSATCHLLH